MVDLPIILNMSQEIPALRRVRALDSLLMLDLPPMAAGATLAGELRLCDSDGSILSESGNAGITPLLAITYFGDSGQVTLQIVTAFTLIAQDPKGWSFSLPLTTQQIADYLGTSGESKEAIFEISLASAGAVRLVYRRAVTLMAAVFDAETQPGVLTLGVSPILKPAITNATQHKAAVTVGASLPVVWLTLEGGSWIAWTLRTRTVDDDPITYPDFFRVPEDFNADTNNVIWVHSAFA